MRTVISSLLVVLLYVGPSFSSGTAAAQSPSSIDDLRYEVVSIKRNTSNRLGMNGSTERPDGGFIRLNLPIMSFIGWAQYPNVAPIDMDGLPEWATKDRYDISAVSPLARRATDEERAAMLRALLEDRLKLAAHVEQRLLDVYDLVPARSDRRLGSGISPAATDCDAAFAADRAAREAAAAAGDQPPPSRPLPTNINGPQPPCAGLFIRNGMEGDTTIDSLIRLLRITAGRPIVDKTGLKGYYRIKLSFAGAMSAAGPSVTGASDLPDLFSALPAQLGLKLEPSKGERDVLVIDRLERPTEN